ncbi:hypothetical protein GCM10009612_47320 [Streptomyces beijiangensis]
MRPTTGIRTPSEPVAALARMVTHDERPRHFNPYDSGTQKTPAPKGAGVSRNDCSAASYSPTGSPLQYHRR